MIEGILSGVGLLTGILIILILLIKCCKPNKLNDSMNRVKISFSHHDQTKIWSTNLENETTQAYGNLQYDNDEYHWDENTFTSSCTSRIQSIIDDTSSVDLGTQEIDGNDWCATLNDATSVTMGKT
ncbi:hypothetical protein Smp_105460 [Schistosoma mansoni]|uniref:hypothetical protein n=1 Tax=Schistosoma mansoni TaxID=6183 RepID=UPI0001A62DA3|nr:hypothetical protein Smp_105460 [Schistosoma mansoni]|eukprot:XP_018650085.1 hypothetical protein Smp_105460 [Schistosoma mansoni]